MKCQDMYKRAGMCMRFLRGGARRLFRFLGGRIQFEALERLCKEYENT